MKKNDDIKYINDEQVEALFQSNLEAQDLSQSKENISAVNKIMKKTRVDSAAKSISEFTVVSIFSTILEFVSLFYTFLEQKSVNKESIRPKNKNKKRDQS